MSLRIFNAFPNLWQHRLKSIVKIDSLSSEQPTGPRKIRNRLRKIEKRRKGGIITGMKHQRGTKRQHKFPIMEMF